MIYKALVTDFDGTLVNQHLSLSPTLASTIQQLVKQGIAFSIASGRPYQGKIQNLCNQLGLSSPQIVRGGSEVYDPKTDSLLWHQYIADDTVRRLIDLLKKKDLYFRVEKDDKYYADDPNVYSDDPAITTSTIAQLIYSDIPKIYIMLKDRYDTSTLDILGKELMKAFSDIHVVKSGIPNGGFGLDVTSEKASKHVAILELSKILQIDPQEMVGVGDGYNDFPLLMACGLKVAMDNAPDDLKAIADLVVPSVEHDGLQKLIQKIFFHRE